MQRLINLSKQAYNEVLPQNNAELKQARGFPFVRGDNEDSHLGRLAALLDIPNWRASYGYGKQSWGNLGKKFVGWQDNVSVAKKVRNVFLAIFFFVPINLITVIVRTPINILRLVTEFLPTLLSNAIRAKLRGDAWQEKENGVGKTLLTIALRFVQALAFLLILASRSITNPVRAIKMAWATGVRHPEFARYLPLWAKIVLGVFLSVLSLSFTLIGYTLLAGIPAIQAGSAAVANFIFGNVTQLMPIVSSLLSALSAYGMAVGTTVSGMLAFIPAASQFVAASAAAMPALLGIAGLAAILIPTVGSAITGLVETIKASWYKSSVAKNLHIDDEEMFEAGFDGKSSTYSKLYGKGLTPAQDLRAAYGSDVPVAYPIEETAPVIVVQHPTEAEPAAELVTSTGLRA
jgi:hypothetical protein